MGKRNPGSWEKLYRLSLVEDYSHKNIRSVRFTKLSGLLILLTVIVLVFGIIYSLIAFTPLRKTIPGYPDERTKRAAIENAIKIDSLESEMTRWSLYAGHLARVLAGEVPFDADSLLAGNPAAARDSISGEEIARRDSLLEEMVTGEDQSGRLWFNGGADGSAE